MSQALVTVQAKQQTAAAAASIGNTVDDDTHSDHTNGTHAEIKKQPWYIRTTILGIAERLGNCRIDANTTIGIDTTISKSLCNTQKW